MAHSIMQFVGYTQKFAQLYLGEPKDAAQHTTNFLWAAQRVIFAVGVFFAMREIQTHLSPLAMTAFTNGLCLAFPEASLGAGVYLFSRGISVLSSCKLSSSVEIAVMVGSANIISGIIAWKWFDRHFQNYSRNFFNQFFRWTAESLGPRIAKQ